MTSELRPCPFCGGDDLAVMELLSRGFRIECEGCGAYSPVIKDGPALLTAWNRRAEQAAELAKFKALAETLAGELQQIEVDAMEYYNEWRETGCDQKDAIRFAFGLGEETRKALREYKEARDV